MQRKCTACEQEEKIQAKTLASQITPLSSSFTQRKCAACELEEKLQPKMIQKKGEIGTADSQIESQINSSKGSGSPMDTQTLSAMNNSFGADFSGVRIHTSSQSVQMNQELRARAFTVGNDIHFNQGEYNPGSTEGKKLLAHELTHTVQQSLQPKIMPQLIQRDDAPQTAPAAPLCYDRTVPQPNAAHPELHPTYEQWLMSFQGMRTFNSREGDTIRVCRSSYPKLG
ncbi:MAG: DUF4157 domain-containing protein [Microscillaceae bacterium]|nr:DUF4157 domain-containing protein [Microscillaceae bacterium]